MLKQGNINIITTSILLSVIYILNIIDYLQTAYAIQTLGLGVELNPVGRFCFEHNCALSVKMIGMLIVLSTIGFITIKIEPYYILVSTALLVFYIVIVTHNFNQLKQAGILNSNQWREYMMDNTISIICMVVTMVCAGAIGGLCAYYKHLKKKK